MTQPQDIKQWLERGLPEAKITVEGDGQHFQAVIISSTFSGKSLLQRQRLVYAALGNKMRGEIHALSMQTLAPEEIGEKS